MQQQQSLLTENERKQISSFLAKGLGKTSARLQLLIFTPEMTESCENCETMTQLYSELVELSNGKIETKSFTFGEAKDLVQRYGVKRTPATVLTVGGSNLSDPALKFYGLPSGYEFSALLEDIADLANNNPSKLSPETIEKIKKLRSKVHIQVFVTPTCPYCPRAVRMAHMLSLVNPEMVDAEMIEATEFPELSEKYSVMAVPKIVINENIEFEGALPEQIFISKIEEALSLTQNKEVESDTRANLSLVEPVTLTDATFSDTVKKSQLLVVDFWAPWCAPCRTVSPILQQLAGEYQGRVTFGKLNVDENPAVSAQFQVEGIPTIMIFKNGNIVDSIVSAYPRSFIETKIKALM
jgi:thioredoxin